MISSQHYQEWQQSAVDEGIVELNVRSLSGTDPYNYLCSEKLDRLNTGVLNSKWLKRYRHIENGGWWSSGLDPLNNWEEMDWGCFKPDTPYKGFGSKLIKYEHPAKTATRAFFPRITRQVWRQVGKRSEIETPDLQAIPNEEVSKAFWQWVIDKNVPAIFTEGVKKAASLLSAGYAALALPGINSGYRSPKDANGNRQLKARHLIPELEVLTGGGREIYICFDQDSKQKTIKGVDGAIATLGGLLNQAGCLVKVMTWDGTMGKGIDDLIFNHGHQALEDAYTQAKTLSSWQRKQASKLTYPVALKVNQRYLGELPIPDSAKIIGLKSAKGTGKTETLAQNLVADAIDRGQPVLVLTHRVQLGEALCSRFGIPYVTQLAESEVGKIFGYGLCVDSLHPNSQARFNAESWEDALIIIDECEQVFWHLLSANTEVKRYRVPVLRQFRELIINTITGGGRVVLSDADLSDISIDYIKGLAGVDVPPWICVNEWKPDQGWNVYNYNDPSPAGIVVALEAHIANGGKPLVLCSGQKVKSKYGTQNLEAHLKQRFPDLRILRTDSETISDPSHPAYGCIVNVNEVLKNYDCVIASPSIETGVSIDIKGHFTSVWGIAQGNLAETSVRQQMARLRAGVERHLWAASYAGGGNLIGNGSTFPSGLLASQDKLYKSHIRQLQDTDFNFDEIEDNFAPISLRTWAYMGARINAGKIKYREAILEGLADEGHNIINLSTDPESGKLLSDELSDLRDIRHEEEAELEAEVAMPTKSQFEELVKKKAKTKVERLQERKYSRWLKYGVDVTSDLILKDDDGWHPKIQMHYYCTVGREHVKARDVKRFDSQLEVGGMALWKPDFNRSQLGAAVNVIEALKILNLVQPGREYRSTDADLVHLAEVAKANAPYIKNVLGVTVRKTDTPIAILQNLLSKVGQKLSYSKREGSDGKRARVYTYALPTDGRELIFESWLSRDTSTPCNNDLGIATTDAPKQDVEVGQADIEDAQPSRVAEAVGGNPAHAQLGIGSRVRINLGLEGSRFLTHGLQGVVLELRQSDDLPYVVSLETDKSWLRRYEAKADWLEAIA
jgi:hypothetical protein